MISNLCSKAIAKTTEKGANQVGGVNFTIDDEYELKAQARNEAIEKADVLIETTAAGTGIVTLGTLAGNSLSIDAETTVNLVDANIVSLDIFDATDVEFDGDSLVFDGGAAGAVLLATVSEALWLL